jgi:hemoglobin-like flavoprotein
MLGKKEIYQISELADHNSDDPYVILLKSPEIQKIIKRYSTKEYSSENIEFIVEVFNYENNESITIRKSMTKKILKKYIIPDGKKQINITDSCLKQIYNEVKLAQPFLFEKAKLQVLNSLKNDSIPRILSSVEKTTRESWLTMMNVYSYEDFGKKFYYNLFKVAPSVKEIFSSRNVQHNPKLFAEVITHCINLLTNLKTLSNFLRSLALRHKSYGCTKIHINIAGFTFFKTLKSCCESWSDELEEAWFFLFSVIGCFMKRWLPDSSVEFLSKCLLL